jgi:hypothetical protein
VVSNGGTGYKVAPAVTITGGSGSGAAATAIITNGVVTSVVITNGGTGYTAAPTISFAAPPVAAYGFIKLQLAPQKNKHSIKVVGDLGSQKHNQEVDFFMAGSYAELHEQMAKMMNRPGITLIKDANCSADMYLQLGCDCQASWVSPEFESGTTKDGAKGYTGKIMYDGGALIYEVTGGPAILGD